METNERIKQDINNFVVTAIKLAAEANTHTNIWEAERLEKQALAYFAGANSLLNVVPEFHNELIDSPNFIALRKLRRKYN